MRDADGLTVARAALPADATFALRYRHSVYGVDAWEHFVAEAGGGLRLVAVSSPSEAVLDYYGAEGTRTRDAAGWHLTLAAPARMAELPLIATETGRRTLVVGADATPLFTGEAAHLSVAIES